MNTNWINKYGEYCPLLSMTTSHIQNTARMIQSGRMGAARPNGTGPFTNWEWLQIFQTELARRNRRAPAE